MREDANNERQTRTDAKSAVRRKFKNPAKLRRCKEEKGKAMGRGETNQIPEGKS